MAVGEILPLRRAVTKLLSVEKINAFIEKY
jgi:hypothetical protein